MIRFGTSGWRAVIGDEFTLANLRRLTRAIARQLGPSKQTIAVGYDTRFMSEDFAAECARTLADAGMTPLLSTGPLPTPVLAYSIVHHELAGGINITASHNPPQYSGLKFSTADGAPAPPEMTRQVEALLNEVDDQPVPDHSPEPLEIRSDYFEQLDRLVDTGALRTAGLRVAVDARFGTTRGWLDAYLERHGVEVTRLHDRRDPLFGGGTPDCSGDDLADLRAEVKSGDHHLGLATDGDGDRFGVVGPDGEVFSANQVLGLLADYLHRSRGWNEGLGRTVATTHLLDRVADMHGFGVHETPVGFKYFNDLLAAEKIFLAGEESAGLSVKGHVPEKDGILACCLAAEMVAAHGPLDRQLESLFQQVGPVFSRRADRRFDATRRDDLSARLEQRPDQLAGVAVADVQAIDGVKWCRKDGSWLLIRVSGTEPVVRVYAEA